ncbi:MAG: hypothetical protein ACK514_02490 [Bacteroidota bacterium]|jgi:hypothetical protein|nr:hypothetical protein [Cytophagales bacterium]MCE2956106.1 hypothetical protein [Flammeovirgaceae bacterium]MCZ8069226.1 hypothetical protein [Cytophagales bacterium]
MRVPFSIVGITLVLIWGYKSIEQELDQIELRKSTTVMDAEIIEINCQRTKKNIVFKINDRTFNERIYLSTEECSELNNQEFIGVKIDSKGNVVFANDDYNDSSELELISAFLICLFLICMIVYYGIIPEIKNIVEKYK